MKRSEGVVLGNDAKGKCDEVFMNVDYAFESVLYGQIGSLGPFTKQS